MVPGLPSENQRRRARAQALVRRLRVRRQRALTALLVAAALAVLGLALANTGGHAKSGVSARARSGRLGSTRSTGQAGLAGSPLTGARARAYAEAVETPEIRHLIALGKPIYCAARRGDEVALTFDDGPGTYTRLAIAKLRKHRVKATFFIVGRNVSLLPAALREERALGAVGDHTFSHPLLTGLSPGEAQTQIVQTKRAVERASGGPVFLFRPPYGAHDAAIDSIVRQNGLLQILWTVDSRDSLGADYAQIERTVIAGLKPGAIVLMHENHGQTIRAMRSIFVALQRKHLRAVSVARLLSDDPPSDAQVRAGGGGCGASASAGRGGG